ncbi:hypothetical protein ACWDRR_42585 [Kitasatospora sp. NPDC003701]
MRTHLLADLVEAAQMVAWTTMQVNSRRQLKPPARLPRPGTRTAARPKTEPLDLSRHPEARPLPEKYRTT